MSYEETRCCDNKLTWDDDNKYYYCSQCGTQYDADFEELIPRIK